MKSHSMALLMTLFALTFSACHSHPDHESAGGDGVPEYRKQVRKDPVAGYRRKIDDPLNDWYFSAQLYETPKTFHYLLKMQYEEVQGEDTVRFPDFGLPPKPSIIKGKDRYSCIVGFLDKDNQFREYKMVSVKDGRELKLTTLNHYTVITRP